MSPELLAGRYELREPIGSGGMARVLVAHDRTLARTVAVKLLDGDTGIPRARERFLREARMAASLTHPNAVAVYDTGTDDGRAFIVMELVDGENLAQALRRDGPFSPADAVAVIDPVLAALGAAHARGLVHRDVKPANVLLGRDGAVKLADFGIAKAAEGLADLTVTGQVIGTPTYLSPEQAAGRPATAASDVYATGVVLYEILAGHPPFRRDHAIAVALAHQQDDVPPLDRERAGLPPPVVAAVHRALQKDPADRHHGAEAFRAALHVGDGRAGTAGAVAGAAAAADRDTVARPPAARTMVAGGPPRARPAAVAAAAAPTRGPRGSAARPPRRGRGRGPLLAGAALVAVLLATGAALSMMDVGLGTPTGDAPPTPSPAAAEDRTTDVAGLLAAPTLGQFAALLAEDPAAAGPRGADLSAGIAAVRAAGEVDRSATATALIEQATGWGGTGELDPQVAERAADLLAGLVTAAPDAPAAPQPDAPTAPPPATDAPTLEATAPPAPAPTPEEPADDDGEDAGAGDGDEDEDGGAVPDAGDGTDGDQADAPGAVPGEADVPADAPADAAAPGPADPGGAPPVGPGDEPDDEGGNGNGNGNGPSRGRGRGGDAAEDD